MSRRLRAGALVAALALLTAGAARAADVTSAQLHVLATRAATDPSALAALRSVDRVDGRSVQIAQALNTGSTADLQARLAALASESAGPAAPVSAAAAQQSAATILAGARYGGAPLPDPVGSGLNKLASAIGRLASGTPGGPVVFWAIAGAFVLALAALGARRMIRRLDPRTQAHALLPSEPAGEDAASLERAAQAAEGSGAFGDAVRLRFRAGLLSLSSRKAIDYRPSLLTTEVARRLHSPQFDSLTATFERIAYGGAPAEAADAAAAREGWGAVLGQEIRT
jgi:hypothetical protein